MANQDGSLVRSNETLKRFSDDNFSRFKYRNNANLKYDNAAVKAVGSKTSAYTGPKMVNGKYDVYFSDNSFSSKVHLFMDMGHEYVHIAQYASGVGASSQALREVGAYTWTVNTLRSTSPFAGRDGFVAGYKGGLQYNQGQLSRFAPEIKWTSYFAKWGLPLSIPNSVLK